MKDAFDKKFDKIELYVLVGMSLLVLVCLAHRLSGAPPQAPRPPQAPPVKEVKPPEPEPIVKGNCSGACTCGCQEGAGCDCGSVAKTLARAKAAERQGHRCGCSQGCRCETCLCNNEDWCGAPGCRCGEAGANRVISGRTPHAVAYRIQRVSVPAPVLSAPRPVLTPPSPTYYRPAPTHTPIYQPPQRPAYTFTPLMSFTSSSMGRSRGRASGC